MTNPESCENIGVLLLGAIIFTGQSVSSFGGFTSGISLVLAGITSFMSDCLTSNLKSPPVTTWLELFSRLSLLSGASHGLTGLLEFYDTNITETSSQAFDHFVPTAIMPHVMPISIVAIVSILFVLGLDESLILLRLSKWLLLLTSFLFITVALFSGQMNFKTPISLEMFPEKILQCVALWTVFITPLQTRGLFQSMGLYLALVFILSFLPQVINNTKSLLLPLGALIPSYEAIQVPMAACGLGMALYSLYIPTIHLALRCHFWNYLTKENHITGTYLNIIAAIGIICCTLVILYNLPQLLFIASLADISKRCLDQLMEVFLPYETKGTALRSRDKSSAKYEELNQMDCSPDRKSESNEDGGGERVLFEDTGHSTDETDIDELVEEYQSKTKVLGPFSNEIPTVFTSRMARVIILGVTVLSVSIYIAVLYNNFLLVFIFCTGLVPLYFGLLCLPKDRSKGNTGCHKSLFSYSIHVVLFSSMLITAWAPFMFWSFLGAALQFSGKVQRGFCWRTKSPRKSRLNLVMTVPAMCTRVQRVQTRCI